MGEQANPVPKLEDAWNKNNQISFDNGTLLIVQYPSGTAAKRRDLPLIDSQLPVVLETVQGPL